MTDDEWTVARDRLYRLLESAARSRVTITYGEAAVVAFSGRFSARSGALMDLLSEIDEAVQAERSVMLASLVVRADTGRPGEGYFAFARDVMGRDVEARQEFWRCEATAVWASYHDEADR
jgi:hypothetical protein